METRTCVDCRKAFTLSEEEQRSHQEKQKVDPTWQLPKRCRECRALRKRPVASPPAPTHVPSLAALPLPPAPKNGEAVPTTNGKEEVRLVLATTDFDKLVRGEPVSWHGCTVVLARIGFDVMRKAIEEAEIVEAKKKLASVG